MQSVNPLFWDELRFGLELWTSGEDPWPEVDERLDHATAAWIDRDLNKIRALLIAIWACESLISDARPARQRKDALKRARWTAGFDRNDLLAFARSNAVKAFNRIKSRSIYGFFRDQGRDTVSERQIKALSGALELVMQIHVRDVFGNFRSRVNRLRGEEENAAEAQEIYERVCEQVRTFFPDG